MVIMFPNMKHHKENMKLKSKTTLLSLVLFISCLVTSNAINDEINSLMAFKNLSVESDPNQFLKDWKPSNSSSPCKWNGVICSDSGHVLELNLSGAGLVGNLHMSNLLESLSSLAHAHFRGNFFYGNLSFSSTPDQSCSLETLDLSENSFYHLIGFSSLMLNCNRLRHLNLSSNRFLDDISNLEFHSCGSLTVLDFSNNSFRASKFPASLVNCSLLETFDVGLNDINLEIPGDLLGNLKNLKHLILSQNQFHGGIPLELANSSQLQVLDLSSNGLTGTIPSWMCSTTTKFSLEEFILSDNYLTGGVPSGLELCLIWLSLSNNQLTGEIPEGIENLVNISILQLANNFLSGKIPPQIGKCKSLLWLDLSNNSLSGTIPPELSYQSGLITPGALSSKKFAYMRGRDGSICRGVGGGFVEMEEIRLERLEYFPGIFSCHPYRVYSGMTVSTFSHNGSMIYIDLSRNSLSGTIPEELGSMTYLQILIMEHNNLTGTIPFNLGKLKVLGILDLSHNFLEGFIPGTFGDLSALTELDVSYNNLTGPIPSTGQIGTMPASKFENNSGLYGFPLQECSSIPREQSPENNEEEELRAFSTEFLHAFLLGFFPSFFLVFVTISSRVFLQYARENWN